MYYCYYYPQNEEPLYSRDYMTFFITMPLQHSNSGTFSHITMISNQVRLLKMLFIWDSVAPTNKWKPTFLKINKSVRLPGLEYPGYDWILSGPIFEFVNVNIIITVLRKPVLLPRQNPPHPGLWQLHYYLAKQENQRRVSVVVPYECVGMQF